MAQTVHYLGILQRGQILNLEMATHTRIVAIAIDTTEYAEHAYECE